MKERFKSIMEQFSKSKPDQTANDDQDKAEESDKVSIRNDYAEAE